MKSICIVILSVWASTMFGQAFDPKKHDQDSLAIKAQEQKNALKERIKSATIQYFVIKAEVASFGYSIFINGSLYIEQKTIPGKTGNQGFLTYDQADQCARLVVEKIKEGEMPPTVNETEIHHIVISKK